MRVAVTGAGGRLGSAVIRQLSGAPFVNQVQAWDLPEHDLDDPDSARHLVLTQRPDAVIHAAAWTDVDGCARQPDVAMRRNGTATGEMALACLDAGASMIMVSTNEVFDGLRTDGAGYRPDEATNPGNPYGAAKLHGEHLARAAYAAAGPEFSRAAKDRREGEPSRAKGASQLAIVRTAWLFGMPGSDFPQKILAAARKTRAEGDTLSLVADETGNPTYAVDLAGAIVRLVEAVAAGDDIFGIHHVVNAGRASRAEWAREVLRLAGLNVPTEDVPMTTWPRPSAPPAWGVLEPTPLPGGPLRDWREALQEYARLLPRFE